MKIHYESAADHLTITFHETERFDHDMVLKDGKVCLTFGPDGVLTEIEVVETSKNDKLVLSYCLKGAGCRQQKKNHGIVNMPKRVSPSFLKWGPRTNFVQKGAFHFLGDVTPA